MQAKTPEVIKSYHSCWAEVDLTAIQHNFHALKKCAGPHTKILSVVKADAYGHGMLEAAFFLDKEGTEFFGVAGIDEGIALRQNHIKKPILIFESVQPQFAREIVDYQLTATVCTLELAAELDRYAGFVQKKAFVHIKIDTGMGRLGVWHKEALEFVAAVNQFKHLAIAGIYTHFPSADTDKKFTQKQIKEFVKLVADLKKMGINILYVHAANSAGLIGFKAKEFNLARPGLALYGTYPNKSFKSKIKLLPALSVKSRIMFVKRVKKGRSLSYSRTFIAKKPMTIATVPIGYSDGYFRAFSNNAQVLVEGVRCNLLGRVTMDQITIDVSRVKKPQVGMEVVLLGSQGKDAITADELAERAKTINYEITCSLGSRLPRTYKVT